MPGEVSPRSTSRPACRGGSFTSLAYALYGERLDLQQNCRVGTTLAFPVHARNSIKLCASSGVSSRTGNSYDLLGIAWQYRWGGGL